MELVWPKVNWTDFGRKLESTSAGHLIHRGTFVELSRSQIILINELLRFIDDSLS